MATAHHEIIQENQPAGITCSHYEAIPGRKHCRHYQENGACSRPDEIKCVEWLKVNDRPTHSQEAARRAQDDTKNRFESSPLDMFGHPNPHYRPEPKPEAPTDLFGDPIPAPKAKRTRRTKQRQRPTAARLSPPPAIDEPIPEREPLCGLTTDDIDSFKALDVEVCLESESFGEVWLVPEYTEADRKEITPQHVATIAWAMEAFRGSKVVSFEKSPQQGKEAE